MPPAVNVTTGSRPFSATQRIELVRSAVLLRGGVELVLAHRLQRADRTEHRAHVRDGVDDVARTRLALRADHRRALGDPAQRLAEVRRTAHERDGERPLVDVMLDVGGRQDLGLVDVVDLERLEDLRLGEVPDPALRHHGDRDGLLDLLDLLGIAHPRDAAVAADVGRDALERHDRARTRVLRDARLVGVDDVHDDAALQHLGEARLDPQRPVLGHGRSLATATVSRPLWIAATEFVQIAAFAAVEIAWKRSCPSARCGIGTGYRRDSSPRRRIRLAPKLRRFSKRPAHPGLLRRSRARYSRALDRGNP